MEILCALKIFQNTTEKLEDVASIIYDTACDWLSQGK